jgi:class 3 adenylate cyclase
VPISLALSGSFAALVLLAAGFTFSLSFFTGLQNTLGLLTDKTRLIIEAVGERTRKQLDPAQHQVEFLARLVSDGHLDVADRNQLDDAMRASLAAAEQIASIVFVDPQLQGRLWVRGPRGSVLSGDRDWHDHPVHSFAAQKALRADASYWGEIVYVPQMVGGGEGVFINMRMPVRTAGEYVGLFVASVQLDELSRLLKRVTVGGKETVFILSGPDHVIAHPALIDGMFGVSDDQPLYKVTDLDDPVLEAIWDEERAERFELADSQPDAELEIYGIDLNGEQHIAAIQWMYGYSDVPWIIGVHYLGSDIAAEWQTMTAAGFTSLVVLLLATAIALWIGRRISAPVRQLAVAAADLQRRGPANVQKLHGSRLSELDTTNRAFNEMLDGMRQREILRDNFGKFVPEAIAEQILAEQGSLAPVTRVATVLFSDIEGFSTIGERMQPGSLIELLNEYFAALIEPIECRGGVIHQFQGDAILATFNLPIEDPQHALNAVQAGLEIQSLVREHLFGEGVQLLTRIGINTGQIVGGTVGGTGRLGYTVHGDAVNLAARVEQMNKKFGTYLLVAETTASLCNDEIAFTAVGVSEVRGRDQPVQLFTPAGSVLPQAGVLSHK